MPYLLTEFYYRTQTEQTYADLARAVLVLPSGCSRTRSTRYQFKLLCHPRRRSLIRTFKINLLDTFARGEKYLSKLDMFSLAYSYLCTHAILRTTTDCYR